MRKLRAFHVDMNVGHFAADYLERWLHELASQGYNAVIWELENAVQWETCPQCAAADAFTKDEIRSLLATCRRLGMEAIPLLQTLGHCEYVLKLPQYQNLAELPDRIDQYCPLNPRLQPFLTAWIDEYLELFGEVPSFHLGADEAWTLGECPRCREFAATHSLSALYIQHINQLSEHVRRRGVRPAIWADMVLHYPQALDNLARDVVLFDWLYDLHCGQGKAYVWGQGLQTRETLSPETLARFGRHLFPYGQEPGRDPETFYTADFLADQGFTVVTCPTSSSARDNIFAPRMYYHLSNVGDMFSKGSLPHLNGSLLTSWTVHLFPWELQCAAIELPKFLSEHPESSLQAYERHYSWEHFGVRDRIFFEAAGLLSGSCLFSDRPGSGHFKDCRGAPADHVKQVLNRLYREGQSQQELHLAHDRLAEYQRALALLTELSGQATRGQDEIVCWQLAAENLIHRARVTAHVIRMDLAARRGADPAPADEREREQLLAELPALRQRTESLYRSILKPARRAEVLEWIYGPLQRHLVAERQCERKQLAVDRS